MNWTTEVEAAPSSEIVDRIGAHESESADAATLAIAKAGALAMIASMKVPGGMLIGVEFAGNDGSDAQESLTVRVRLVEAPPEAEVAEAEEAAQEPAPAA